MVNKYRVNSLFIYPVKSLSGIELKEVHAEIKGFQHDRRWMITDKSGLFITQRRVPSMALLKTAVVKDGIRITAPQSSMNGLFIPFELAFGARITVRIWDDEVDALSASEEYNNWFSEVLGMECRLVYMDHQARRAVNQKYSIDDETVSFADGFPYTVTSLASLNDLNSMLEDKIPMDRFRPNIVIEGGEAFVEDSIDEFIIGSVKFKAVKPCSRCKVITIDQVTAIPGDEPLAELSKYRKKNNKVYFGYNALCLNPGVVRKGDPIEITHCPGFSIES